MTAKKILVVNNDLDTMSLIQQLLETNGYKVKYSGNRNEVIELLYGFKPDLLLIDILQMGILKKDRLASLQQQMPILMMTGYNHYADAPVLSPDAFIKKPFTLEELISAIEKLLSKKS